ncbi:MAG: tyrosine-type recombinase/integrase [Bacteroidia bacterium]|nr:tyrosine-type recombinase/integrase [Bacteroidia bacterium]
MNWPEAIVSFSNYLEQQLRYSHHTCLAYKNDLVQWNEFIESNKPDHPESSAQRAFLMILMKNNYEPRTVRRKLSALKKFSRYIFKKYGIQIHGLGPLTGPKTPKALPSYFTQNEINKMFSIPFDTEDYNTVLKRTLMKTIYYGGFRKSEILNLKSEQINFSTNEIRVLGKRKKERIVPMLPELKEELQHFMSLKGQLGLSNEYVFVNSNNKKVSGSFLYRAVREFFDNISSSPRKSPHVLRHTFATFLLNEGANIQAVSELLGHSGLASTQIYTHIVTEKLIKTYKQSHPRSGE